MTRPGPVVTNLWVVAAYGAPWDDPKIYGPYSTREVAEEACTPIEHAQPQATAMVLPLWLP